MIMNSPKSKIYDNRSKAESPFRLSISIADRSRELFGVNAKNPADEMFRATWFEQVVWCSSNLKGKEWILDAKSSFLKTFFFFIDPSLTEHYLRAISLIFLNSGRRPYHTKHENRCSRAIWRWLRVEYMRVFPTLPTRLRLEFHGCIAERPWGVSRWYSTRSRREDDYIQHHVWNRQP